ncbi:MAG: FHA domain-containing protein [Pseudomonadota bacterium]
MKFIKDMISKNGEAPVVPPKAKSRRKLRVPPHPGEMDDMSSLEFGGGSPNNSDLNEVAADEAGQNKQAFQQPDAGRILRLTEAQMRAVQGAEAQQAPPEPEEQSLRNVPLPDTRVPSSHPEPMDPQAPTKLQRKIWDMQQDGDGPRTAAEAAAPPVAAEEHPMASDAAQAPVPQPTPSPSPRRGLRPRDEAALRAAIQRPAAPDAEDAPGPVAATATAAAPVAPAPQEEPSPGAAPVSTAMPKPRAGRAGGRVKTRLLGFAHSDGTTESVFEQAEPSTRSAEAMFPAGWILLVDGPGRGNSFTLFTGVAQIGRGEDQAIRLDFGDNSISRTNHAAVAYDAEQRKFFLGHGGKSNLVRLNGQPVLSTEELSDGDLIRIGETTLRFVALCGPHFTWDDEDDDANDET